MTRKQKSTQSKSEQPTRLIDEVICALSDAPAGSYLDRADLIAAARHIIAHVQAGRWRAAHDIAVGLHAEVSKTTQGVVLFNGSGERVELTPSSSVRANPETRRLGQIVS
jgi:hypothetical protein